MESRIVINMNNKMTNDLINPPSEVSGNAHIGSFEEYQRQYENNVGFKYSERNLKKNVILIGVKMR